MFRQKLLLWMMIGVLLLAGCGGDEPEAVEPETAVSQPTAQTEQAAAAETAVEPTSVPVAVELTAVSPTHLEATLHGGPVTELVKHIKAVTYHNLAIVPTHRGLETTIVFDV